MLMSALCMIASLPAVMAKTPLGFVLLISIATFGHGGWGTATQTLPGDIVAPRFVGTSTASPPSVAAWARSSSPT